MQKSLKYSFFFVLFLSGAAVALLMIAPSRIPRGGSQPDENSLDRARLWRQMLLDCNSPADVRDNFYCGISNIILPDGTRRAVTDPNVLGKDKPWALLYEFANGDWMAVAVGGYHGRETVVARGSHGYVRMYFGHACGNPGLFGRSIDEIYSDMASRTEWQEISVSDLIEHGD
jgi:hypothetical protein